MGTKRDGTTPEREESRSRRGQGGLGMPDSETMVAMTPVVRDESTSGLLRELVAHLRQNRTQLREEWAHRITEAKLLTAMSPEEVFAEATAVYDNYLEAL